MIYFKLLLSLLGLFAICNVPVQSFIPAELVEDLLEDLGTEFIATLDKVSETLTHDDIIEYGISQSIADYFRDQVNGSLIQSSKYDDAYKSLKEVYYDYYGLWMCDLESEFLAHFVFRPNIAIVDLSSATKDNPYYHFDAERLKESNVIVMNVTSQIYQAFNEDDYPSARKFTGRVLHTIQDFYSHTNWVESGNTDINTKIGTDSFNQSYTFIDQTEADPCISNCTEIVVECTEFLNLINNISESLFNKTIQKCPIRYYRCFGNIQTTKLVSGYYGGQKLENGDSVPKPSNLNKCSHGGMLDPTSSTAAAGGINKDR